MPFLHQFVHHFLGTSTSKQWSLNVGKMDIIRSVSSKHCSNILFIDFEQVGQLSIPHFEKKGIEKNERLGVLKEFLPQLLAWEGSLICFFC